MTLKHFSTIFFVSAMTVLAIFASVSAEEQLFNKAMQPLVAEYLTITKTLAADKTTGVKEAAKKIETLSASLKTEEYKGQNANAVQKIPGQLQTTAKALQQAKDIEAMREVLQELSKPFALWASLTKPDGLYVAYCPMKPGSWLQDQKEINNPYYGSKMLRCGKIVSPK
ncbi:DUF3347 domain-containing protein [candidate division CSSED10-310 bacterium]|uniref:DUF3347 domain-containing protein n=1 Tax=candidate division CSSED10-310 bacterium TaxID=2855610 RepID=A0ABV6YSW1_UNCC1